MQRRISGRRVAVGAALAVLGLVLDVAGVHARPHPVRVAGGPTQPFCVDVFAPDVNGGGNLLTVCTPWN